MGWSGQPEATTLTLTDDGLLMEALQKYVTRTIRHIVSLDIGYFRVGVVQLAAASRRTQTTFLSGKAS